MGTRPCMSDGHSIHLLAHFPAPCSLPIHPSPLYSTPFKSRKWAGEERQVSLLTARKTFSIIDRTILVSTPVSSSDLGTRQNHFLATHGFPGGHFGGGPAPPGLVETVYELLEVLWLVDAGEWVSMQIHKCGTFMCCVLSWGR